MEMFYFLGGGEWNVLQLGASTLQVLHVSFRSTYLTDFGIDNRGATAIAVKA